MPDSTDFLSCDWGTSSFRLRLVRVEADGPRAVDEVRSKEGVRELAGRGAAGYAEVLEQHTRVLLERHGLEPLPTVISGMASSSVGWRELPYARLPFALDGRDLSYARLSEEPPVFLLSGVCAEADVMRGEETELMGLAELPADCLVVLAGTHAKHVRIEGGVITDFRTYLTGELYDVLGHHSLLAHSVGSLEGDCEAAPERFREGVQQGADGALAHDLFTVRAGSLLQGHTVADSRALLSGMLIGHELADLVRRYPAGPVWLAAPPHQARLYEEALAVLGQRERLAHIDPEAVAQSAVRAHARLLTAWRVLPINP